MARKTLTDRGLNALKAAREGTRYDVMDSVVPGLGVRVTDKGNRSFILAARFPARVRINENTKPGPPRYTRRELGQYGELTLERAREKARDWLDLIRKGIDPAVEEERLRQAEIKRQEITFGAVFDDFAAEKLAKERKGEEVKRDITNNFIPRWKSRPITELTDLDVLAVINAKKKTAPSQARNLLGQISRLFQWAINQRVYEVTVSPCANLKPKEVIGKKKRGQRVLDNDELRALWRAAKRLPYPVGPAYRLLMLTALRLNESARASWPEFNPAVVRALRRRRSGEQIDWSRASNEPLTWIIPAERMKGENEEARPHLVPLTPDILEILESLPLFKGGDYLFSTTFGKKPVSIGSKIKKRVDARMLRTLRALARIRGEDPRTVKLKDWDNHDIRRTARSNLSRLRVTEEAREAVIAHARPGIKGTYDVYDYADEKREALILWGARLRSIVEPPTEGPLNVVHLKTAVAG